MQGLFTKWLKKNKWNTCACFELKITKGKSLPLSRIEAHQMYYLNKAENGGFAYKISDQSLGMKPWDCMWFMGDAYVVVLFYEPRKKKVLYVIPVKALHWHAQSSGKKSINEQDALNISHYQIEV